MIKVYDKSIKTDEPVIEFGNDYVNDSSLLSKSEKNELKFDLVADLEPVIKNINENYLRKDSEDDPIFLNTDLQEYVDEWLNKNIPGHKHKYGQYGSGLVEVVGDPIFDKGKLNKLKTDLTNWIENCYSYAW